MTDAAETEQVTPARKSRRSQRAQQATIEATIELLQEVGYHELTIEAIAARAGVGKATIYRWWSSKAALVLDSLIATLPDIEYHVSDSVRDDLYWRQEMSGRRVLPDASILAGLAADLWHGRQELLAKMRDELIRIPRESMRLDLQRAIQAGVLAEDADLDLIMDLWTGTQLFRSLMSGRPIDVKLGRWLVDLMLDHPPRLNGPARVEPS